MERNFTDMEIHMNFWWVLAGILIAAELFTGTFYLLLLALGAVAAALVAWSGAGVSAQLIVAAIVSAGSVTAGYVWRSKRPSDASSGRNRDVILDVGELVEVSEWSKDGTAKVHYRGATWQAQIEPGSQAVAGPQRIVGMNGSALILKSEHPLQSQA